MRHQHQRQWDVSLSEVSLYLVIFVVGLALGFGYLWFLNQHNQIDQTLNQPSPNKIERKIPGA